MFQESCGTTRTSSSRIWSRSPISTIRTYARWNGFREEEKFTATHFREILYARRKENPTRKYYFFTYKNKFSILDYKSTSYFNPQINVLCFIIVVVHSEKENRNRCSSLESRWEKEKKKKVHKRARAHTHTHARHAIKYHIKYIILSSAKWWCVSNSKSDNEAYFVWSCVSCLISLYVLIQGKSIA